MLQKVFVVTLIVVDLPPNKHFSSLSEIEGGSALSIHFCIFMGLESRKKGEKKVKKKESERAREETEERKSDFVGERKRKRRSIMISGALFPLYILLVTHR